MTGFANFTSRVLRDSRTSGNEPSAAFVQSLPSSETQNSHLSTTPTLQFIVTEDVFVTAIFDTIEVGIEDAEEIDITVYSTGMRIIVKGAEGHDVRLFDVNGRLINVATKVGETTEFRVNATGVYLIKVDNYPAKRVLVVR